MNDWLEELSSDDSLHDFIVRDECVYEEDKKDKKPKKTFEVEIITPRRSNNEKIALEEQKVSVEEEKEEEEDNEAEVEEEEEVENEWEVEDIMKQKIVKGEEWYLIKWRGYDELTWEPLDHLNCPELLSDFLNRSGLKSVYFESQRKPSSSAPQITSRTKSQRISNKTTGGFSSVAKFKGALSTSTLSTAKSSEALPGYKRKHGYDASVVRSETEKELEKQLRERENLIQSLNSQYASLPKFKKARVNLITTPRRTAFRSCEKESILPPVIPNHSLPSQATAAQSSPKKAEEKAVYHQDQAQKPKPQSLAKSSGVNLPSGSSSIHKPLLTPERNQIREENYLPQGSPHEPNRLPKMSSLFDPSLSPKTYIAHETSYSSKVNQTRNPDHSPNMSRVREPDHSSSTSRAQGPDHPSGSNWTRESNLNLSSQSNRSVIISKSVSDPRKSTQLIPTTINRNTTEFGTPAPTPQSAAEAMFGSVPLFSKNPPMVNNFTMNGDSDSSGSFEFNEQKERPFTRKHNHQPKANSKPSADWLCRFYKGKMKEVGQVHVGPVHDKDTKLFDIIKEKNDICFSKTIRYSYVKSLIDLSSRNCTISICYVHLANKSNDKQKYSRFNTFLVHGGLVGIATYKNLVIIVSPVNSELLALLQNPSDNLGRMCLLLINDTKLAREGLHYDELLPETLEFTTKRPVTTSNLHLRTWESLLGIKANCTYNQVSIFGPSHHPEVTAMETLLKHQSISLDSTMEDSKTKALLIHRSSLSQIHMIPNLNDLKQRENFIFVVFGFSVNIPPEQILPNIVFPSGGVVAITDELLLTNDRILHKLMEYKDLKRHVEPWRIVISDTTVTALRTEVTNNNTIAIKNCQIVEDLIRSERIKCIATDASEETKPESDGKFEILGMMLKLQSLFKAEYRHFIVLTTEEKIAPSRLGIQFVEPSNVSKWFKLEK